MTLNILSLGAGVQSSTMALMAAHGELPRVNAAIFADTGAEPDAVYEWLDYLESVVTNALRVDQPFPVYRVSAPGPDLKQRLLLTAKGEKMRQGVPLYGLNNDGTPMILMRQCTSNFKIDPLRKKLRDILGLVPRQRVPKGTQVNLWMGITTDEAVRMKPSRDKWITHTWPLIEKRMSRGDCLEWMAKYDLTPPKSACSFCPFHSDAMWRDIKLNDPKSWADAVEVDEAVRGGVYGSKAKALYLHKSLTPLSEIDFRNLEDKGQLNMFNNECEGMCGV
jgi:hypothetical protein